MTEPPDSRGWSDGLPPGYISLSEICCTIVTNASCCAPPGGRRASLTPSSPVALATRGGRGGGGCGGPGGGWWPWPRGANETRQALASTAHSPKGKHRDRRPPCIHQRPSLHPSAHQRISASA